ncbi:MAG: LysR family transcriptional regulator [Pseudomonadota bacterium]
MELRDVDLNLLVVFNQLLTEQNVTRVADNLRLSQPAVSNALGRLRKIFGDELFLRTSTGMKPTPFAIQMGESVSTALGVIHGAINFKTSFEPKTSERRFSIGMTDIGEIYFLPLLMKEIRRLAPSVTVTTVRNTATNLRDELEAGRIDLAIGLLPQLKGGFFQRRLFLQNYVCLLREGHKLDKPKISLAEFFAADHAVIVSAGTGHGKVDSIIDSNGLQRRIVLTVPHFVAVGHILQSSDMLTTVPERLATSMVKPFNLKYVAHPVKLPQIAINLFWHAKYNKDPANQWLRTLVFDLHSD